MYSIGDLHFQFVERFVHWKVKIEETRGTSWKPALQNFTSEFDLMFMVTVCLVEKKKEVIPINSTVVFLYWESALQRTKPPCWNAAKTTDPFKNPDTFAKLLITAKWKHIREKKNSIHQHGFNNVFDLEKIQDRVGQTDLSLNSGEDSSTNFQNHPGCGFSSENPLISVYFFHCTQLIRIIFSLHNLPKSLSSVVCAFVQNIYEHNTNHRNMGQKLTKTLGTTTLVISSPLQSPRCDCHSMQ